MDTGQPVGAAPVGQAGFYAPAEPAASGSARRTAIIAAIVALHAVLLVLLGYAAVRPEALQPIRALAVRMLEAPPPPVTMPKIEPLPKPPPVSAKPVAQPVLAVPRKADVPASFVVAPPPESVTSAAPAAAPPAAPSAPAPVTAARFDADYLQNPKPAYPPMSRRLGEEGKVILRVRVSAQGGALAVDISQSSGFARLDDAARAAVERWRFVPAKQAGEAIESSVLVPLNFTLNN